MKFGLAAGAVLLSVAGADAKLVTRPLEYKAGDTALVGYLAYDDAVEGKRPGVLVVHEWWGLDEYARRRAEQVAELGYVALAVDMYGGGRTTRDPKQAGEWSGQVRRGPAWRERIKAAFDVLAGDERVDPRRIAAIGYCFGGASALQLAYCEPRLAGAVSFHGSLPPPDRIDYPNLKAKLLILHGAADDFVSAKQIEAFQEALDSAGADWQMILYSGAVHSFTNPEADKAGLKRVAYNKKADQRSWEHMKLFLKELFDRDPHRNPEPKQTRPAKG